MIELLDLWDRAGSIFKSSYLEEDRF